MQGSSTLLKPLLEAGLVDELKLLINPSLAGNGKRPFISEINCGLELSDFRRFEKNVVLLTYKPTVNTDIGKNAL